MALLDFPEVLRVHGVMAKGYGIICKFPMTDPELSLSAKAVYAMICSMAGNDRSTFPSRDKITGYLKIGKDKSTLAIKELTTQGYLSVSKRIPHQLLQLFRPHESGIWDAAPPAHHGYPA